MNDKMPSREGNTIDAEQFAKLQAAAMAASGSAYAPYSKFQVGAAVLCDRGKIHAACNVENASYGLSICAERAAVFAAVADGARSLIAVAIYTPTRVPTAPCGACRQVINEFGPHAHIHSACSGDETLDVSLDQLLPTAFGPANLSEA